MSVPGKGGVRGQAGHHGTYEANTVVCPCAVRRLLMDIALLQHYGFYGLHMLYWLRGRRANQNSSLGTRGWFSHTSSYDGLAR